jgi:hypothetical protein
MLNYLPAKQHFLDLRIFKLILKPLILCMHGYFVLLRSDVFFYELVRDHRFCQSRF